MHGCQARWSSGVLRSFAGLLGALGCSPSAPGPQAPGARADVPLAPPVDSVLLGTAAPPGAPRATETADAVAQPAAPREAEPLVAAASSTGWSMFHGDGARTGLSPAPAVTRPHVRWRAEVGIQGYLNSPLVAGSLVIVPSSGTKHDAPDAGDGVYALDLATGRTVWHTQTSDDANGAAIAGDRVIVTSDDGTVRGLDLATGREVWKRPGKGQVYSHPLLVGDEVIVGDASGTVRAFGAVAGDSRWQVPVKGAIRGGTAADDSAIYVVSQEGEVIALSPAGALLWHTSVTRPSFDGKTQVPIEGYAAPVVAGDLLVIPFARDTSYDTPAFVAVERRTGAVRWLAKGRGTSEWGNVRSTPALVAGLLVYSEPYSGDVVGLEALTGHVRFRRTVGACYFPQYASPAAAGDIVYVPRFDGVLYAVRSQSGMLVWRTYLGDKALTGTRAPGPPKAGSGACEWDVPSGSPLYAPVAIAPDGTVLVGNGAGTLFALEQQP